VKPEKAKLKRWSPAFRWIALLCLLLVAASAVAQGFHYHADETDGTSKQCSICMVLHSPASNVEPIQIEPAFSVVEALQLPHAPDHFVIADINALFCRPPPVA
jgi:hypothetical protein